MRGHTENSAPDWGPPPKPRRSPTESGERPKVSEREYRDTLPTLRDGLMPPLVTLEEEHQVHDTIPAPPPAPYDDDL